MLKHGKLIRFTTKLRGGFVLIVLFTTTFCNPGKPKIGLLLPNNIVERYPKDGLFFSKKVKELGGEVFVCEAQNNDKLQMTQAEELIEKGVEVLVIVACNKNTIPVVVRNAHKKKVKVIAYERIISNCDLDYFVTFNNVNVGELMARYAIKSKPEGNYVILGGDYSNQNAIWVEQGMRRIIDPYVKSGKIKILYRTFVEDWTTENTYFEVTRFINLSGIIPDVFLASNDGMSLGVIKALDNFTVSAFPYITGQDANLLACRHIVKGKQGMTVYKPIIKEAELAADLAMKIARNEKIPQTNNYVFNGTINVPTYYIDPIPVDKSNIKNTVIADGFQKEPDVYEK